VRAIVSANCNAKEETGLGVDLLRSVLESGLTLLEVTPRMLRFGGQQQVAHDLIRRLEFASGRAVVIEDVGSQSDMPVEPREVARDQTGNGPTMMRVDRFSGSAARAADELIEGAVDSRASDIHIEPDARGVRVRYRIDGELIETARLPESLRDALVSRIKIMASLDIAEKRRPQDGRIRYSAYQRPIDLRVSTMPGVFGEKVVVRVLDRESIRPDLRSLGMTEMQVTLFASELQRTSGLILVTGPTGSGKTTTLYAALQTLDTDRRNVITIEDPIEYELPGVSQ
jgi:type IV pilus assembly protein PilB